MIKQVYVRFASVIIIWVFFILDVSWATGGVPLNSNTEFQEKDHLAPRVLLQKDTFHQNFQQAITIPKQQQSTAIDNRAIAFQIAKMREKEKNNLQNGQFEDAMKIGYEILEVDPKNVEAMNTIGKYLLEPGRNLEAIDWFIKAINLAPENPVIRFNLADVYRRGANYVEALEQVIIAISLSDGNKGVAQQLKEEILGEMRPTAVALVGTYRNYSKARNFCKAILNDNPYDTRTMRIIQDCCICEGRKEEARLWEERIIEIEASNGSFFTAKERKIFVFTQIGPGEVNPVNQESLQVQESLINMAI